MEFSVQRSWVFTIEYGSDSDCSDKKLLGRSYEGKKIEIILQNFLEQESW